MAKTVGEVAAAIHADMCNDDDNGYSWSPRHGEDGKPVKTLVIDGREYSYDRGSWDCSSSTAKAWQEAIRHTGYAGKLDGAQTTHNFRSVFTASGLFEWKPMSFTASPGDLYLDEDTHVAMCQSQVPDLMSEFCINENGEVYNGQVGDQTGREAAVNPFRYDSFDGILHYNGKADGATPKADGTSPDASGKASGPSKKAQPRYAVMANWAWLAEMRGRKSTDPTDSDAFAGMLGAAMQYLACDAARYRVKTELSGWLPWVTAYDLNDLESGCAGDGSAIVAVEVDDSTVRFRVHLRGGRWLPWMLGRKDSGGSKDTFGGDGATPIDLIQMVRA